MRFINDKCNNCGDCMIECLSGAIMPGVIYKVTDKCVDCMACVAVCKQGAIVEYIEPIEDAPETEFI